jgi:PqqD family protein of HPr-rel-A system
MTKDRSAPSRESVWRIDPDHATAWRAWDGEIVVYDDLSGDTLKLDVIMAATFQRLQQGASSLDVVADHLATTLDLEGDPRLRRLAEIALERLSLSELIVAGPL